MSSSDALDSHSKTGALMATLVLPLVVGRKVEFIEQCGRARMCVVANSV
jgi:hypothetical protein